MDQNQPTNNRKTKKTIGQAFKLAVIVVYRNNPGEAWRLAN